MKDVLIQGDSARETIIKDIINLLPLLTLDDLINLEIETKNTIHKSSSRKCPNCDEVLTTINVGNNSRCETCYYKIED